MKVYNPYNYQRRAIAHILNHHFCALWLDMGLGKTAVTLTAIAELLDSLEARRVLVIAPLSVARNTWTAERDKWQHLRGLTIEVAVGTEKQRIAAIEAEAEVTVINRENVEWLVSHSSKTAWPFDMVVIDEASSFKNPASRRFKALRKIRPQVRRLVELTGTPSPNGLMDLWAQAWLLDFGQRLGRTLTAYRNGFFKPGRHNGPVVYEWKPLLGSAEMITRRLSDICLSMQAADYLQLPDLLTVDIPVRLDDADIERYRKFERDNLIELQGDEITATQAATLTGKLLQYTGGGVYDDAGQYVAVHAAKIAALTELVESAGEPVLVFYAFAGERERILAEIPEARHFTGQPEILRQWNEGKVPVLLCHPASVGYGLNLQGGGRLIVWFSPTWNLEHYRQANARLHRQGQQKPVAVYRLLVPDTVDARVVDALEGKGTLQDFVLDAVKSL